VASRLLAYSPLGIWIQWNGIVDWNGGMDWTGMVDWNGMVLR